MNKRTVHIVQVLSHSTEPCSISGLAREFRVSERTIRNDLTILNVFLSKESLGQISLAAKGVIILPEGFSKAEGLLPVEDTFAYKMSADERMELGAAILISATGYMTLGNLADIFSVSRATILNDLDGIKQRVRDAGLEVVSKPSCGVIVHGDEGLRRKFLLGFISGDAPIVDKWFSLPENVSMREDAIIIKKILNEQCHASGCDVPDQPFQLLTSYLCLAVSRSRRGMCIGESDVALDGCSPEDVGSFERKTVNLVGQYCSVALGPGEVLAFASFRQKLRGQGESQFNIYDMRVQKLSRVFIRNVSDCIGIDLNNDYDLFEYLSNHLESMFTTEPSRFPENPALTECVNDRPEVLSAVQDNLGLLEDYAEREITHVETLYIALHICAALERRKSQKAKPRVIVVCDGGVGTSQLLAEELRNRFDIKIVKVLPAHDTPYIETYYADLVISTVPLSSCPVDTVVVRLPLREKGYQTIRAKLATIEPVVRLSDPEEEVTAQGILERIEPIIRRHVPNDNDLVKAIRLEVWNCFHATQDLENQLIAPFLHQLLPPSHIQLDVACDNWRSAICRAARPLVEMGYIEERYVKGMIEDTEKYGPYSVLVPGFAVPHSAPENGAVKMGMNLIRLKDPVSFGSEENDPIRFVCVLSAVDHKMHLRAFTNLVDLLTMSSNGFFEALTKAKSPEEASLAIEQFEFMIV